MVLDPFDKLVKRGALLRHVGDYDLPRAQLLATYRSALHGCLSSHKLLHSPFSAYSGRTFISLQHHVLVTLRGLEPTAFFQITSPAGHRPARILFSCRLGDLSSDAGLRLVIRVLTTNGAASALLLLLN